MLIMFDLMGTVIGSIDLSPRPGIKETIKALRESGNDVRFWTSGPVDYYRSVLENLGIPGEVFPKNATVPFKPDLCIDDEPQDWMPGRVYRVNMHVSDCTPGEHILAAELIGPGHGDLFFWD